MPPLQSTLFDCPRLPACLPALCSGTGLGIAAEAAAAAAEEERKRLRAELEMARAAMKAHEGAALGLQAELAALRLHHAEDASTAGDVLQSQQRERDRMEEATRALERRLEAESQEVVLLRSDLQAALEKKAAAGEQTERQPGQGGSMQPSSEVQRLLSQSRRQEERMAAQQAEVLDVRQRLQRAEQALEVERSRAASLQVRAQSRTELRFVRDGPWLIHVRPERLTGLAPAAPLLPGGTLAVAGRQMLLEAWQPAARGGAEQQPGHGHEQGQGHQQAVQHMLDLSAARWGAVGGGASAHQPAASAEGMHEPVSGRAVCSIGEKLLGFGGTRNGKFVGGSTEFFHPNLRQWLPAPPPADPAVQQPPPRHSAALAYCPNAHAAFLYGGQGEGGTLLGDLWRLDCTSMAWKQLDSHKQPTAVGERARTPCPQEAPPSSTGAALAVSTDGSRLWLMGGRLDSGRCSNALHW